MIEKDFLLTQYVYKKKSAHDIAVSLECSENKVNYWLQKHAITKRSISEALYERANPHGDPFKFVPPTTKEEWFLFGIGIGLYWGEGNKANKHSVRLGNTDPALLRHFILFLEKIFTINTNKLRFGLQIFSDCEPDVAQKYWMTELGLTKDQFQKIIVTPSRASGTYKYKNSYGVLTIYFSNIKIRDSIVSAISALQTNSSANVAQLVERIHGKS